VTRCQIHDADGLPGLIAILDGQPQGLLIYHLKNNECEIVVLNALIKGKKIGSTLVHSVINMVREKKCNRVWFITTNDNTDALCFYQKLGFEMVAIYRNAIIESRKLKPEIPDLGMNDIPIRDEIELEYRIEEAHDN
jgi:GNAT superfamily N-acetyltransferase